MQSSWQKYVLNLSNLFHYDNQDHIFEFHCHLGGEQLCLYLLEVSIQLLYQENFRSPASHIWYIFISAYVSRGGLAHKVKEFAPWHNFLFQ